VSETYTPEIKRHIIDYPSLVDTAQLSAARLLDIEHSLELSTFAEVLAYHPPENHEQIIAKVGTKFDDALMNFVTAAIIGRRNQDVVILADAREGFGGHLPWEPRLAAHVENLRSRGLLSSVNVWVERYSTDDQEIEMLAEEARALAVETTPEFYTA
jgi:hypothetical protein